MEAKGSGGQRNHTVLNQTLPKQTALNAVMLSETGLAQRASPVLWKHLHSWHSSDDRHPSNSLSVRELKAKFV
jgi:hypothetical protein